MSLTPEEHLSNAESRASKKHNGNILIINALQARHKRTHFRLRNEPFYMVK